MKKRLSILLLAVLVFPIVALFGCDEVSSFSVDVSTSSISYGSVSGAGTYSDGSTVTLTATAKKGSHFIAWVRQNSLQIEQNDTFKIENTLNSDKQPQKSVLTFSINSNTQGLYTAVFDDGKQQYVKFDSMRLSTKAGSKEEEDNVSKATIMTANTTLLQGEKSDEVFSIESAALKESVAIRPEKVDKVLKLSTDSTQTVRATSQLNYANKNATIAFRADLKFQESTPKDSDGDFQEIRGNNYTYHVEYANGIYEIVFTFALNGKTFYLTLTYKNL